MYVSYDVPIGSRLFLLFSYYQGSGVWAQLHQIKKVPRNNMFLICLTIWGEIVAPWDTNTVTNRLAVAQYGPILGQNEAYTLYQAFGSLVGPISAHI